MRKRWPQIVICAIVGFGVNLWLAHRCLFEQWGPGPPWLPMSAQWYWNRYADDPGKHGPAKFEHLSGAVGCDFADVFNAFGTQVSLIEVLPGLLPLEDADVSAELTKAFKKRKIDLHTGAKVEKVENTATGVKVTMTVGTETRTLEAEILLSAVGRSPVTEDIGLDKTNIKTERGFIKADSMMRTSEPNVYAAGDVLPTPMLAHVGSAEAVLAVEHIAGKSPQAINYDLTPSATYCYPEVASVGLTEKKAKERGYDVKAAIFPFSAVMMSPGR